MDFTDDQRAEMHNRYEELFQSAVSRVLDKMDIDIYEWMDESEVKEYITLEYKLGMLDECDYKSLLGIDQEEEV